MRIGELGDGVTADVQLRTGNACRVQQLDGNNLAKGGREGDGHTHTERQRERHRERERAQGTISPIGYGILITIQFLADNN